jgi:hypothetical protein
VAIAVPPPKRPTARAVSFNDPRRTLGNLRALLSFAVQGWRRCKVKEQVGMSLAMVDQLLPLPDRKDARKSLPLLHGINVECRSIRLWQ